MIRGAFILGIGFSLGYGKALHDSQEIKDLLLRVIDGLSELSKAASKESAEGTTATPSDTVDSNAVDVTPPPTEGL